MSQQDLYKNEVIEEILRERTNSHNLLNKKNDFWILTSPKFIENLDQINLKIQETNFYKQKKNMLTTSNKLSFYTAILSPSKEFITWLSLRLGYFEDLETYKKMQIINSNYISNGIFGKIILDLKEKKNLNYFEFIANSIHPNLLIKKYQKLLDLFQN
jgi:hypothetical protein